MIRLLVRALEEHKSITTFNLLFQLKQEAEKADDRSMGVGKYKEACKEGNYFLFVHDPEEGSMIIPFHWPLAGTPTFNQGVQEAKRRLGKYGDA